MSQKTVAVENTGQALLLLLRERGVEYFFANAGTDFAPLIDGFSRFSVEGFKVPRPIVVPHENTAVAMAHGYYLLTGRPQAVMVHVTVGTANAVNGIINAARGNAPIIFLAGRTPYTESGLKGSRDFHIHWPQESFDQASMLREYVKWDYELRNFHQLESVVDRAFEIAMSEPKGPVYLVLPREVIAEAQTQVTYMKQPRRDIGGQAYPDPESVKRAAAILAEAKRPLIITTTVGRNHEAVGSLTELAESWAIPVVTPHPTFVCLPTDHPMHGGQTPDPFLDEADAILNIDCDVPWLPQIKKPNESCKVIEMALDPSFKEFPIRSFPRDVAVRGASTVAIPMLIEALKPHREKAGDRIAERYRTVGGFIASQRAKFKENLLAMQNESPIDPRWVAHCIGRVKDDDTVIVKEYSLALPYIDFRTPGTYFGNPRSGGLGWGLGAAVGMKLAAPEKTVISVVGDGCYMFGNPTPSHFVSNALDAPTLTVIINNNCWQAVRMANLMMYPDGWASNTEHFPLCNLTPSPRFELIVTASGGYGEFVEQAAELEPALHRALRVVKEEGRQAVLNVSCKKLV